MSTVMKPIRTILAIALSLLIAASFLPLLETDAWWVRMLDFPRLQFLLALAVLGALFLFTLRGRSMLPFMLLAGISAAIVDHAIKLAPYFAGGSQVASVEACPAGEGFSVMVANLKLGNREAGRLIDADETVVVTGHDANDVPSLFVFHGDGTLNRTIPLADAKFVNGATFLSSGVTLVNDAQGGRIYRVDLDTGEVSIWLEATFLAPDPQRSELIPGANGIKVHDGYVYVTNSSRMTVVRLPIIGADQRPGKPETIASDVVLDDFAMAADGTIYGTTHLYDSVVRVELDGTRTTIATAQDGVTGSTAAFGRGEDDSSVLYVVGDGGVYLDPDNLVQPQVVALSVGEPGLPLLATFQHVSFPGKITGSELSLVRCTTDANSADALKEEGPNYTRFLELNLQRIMFAGQEYGGGRDEAPTARQYFVAGKTTDDAKRMMEASPYYTGGVYAECDARPFDVMLGSVVNGVAWPPETSEVKP